MEDEQMAIRSVLQGLYPMCSMLCNGGLYPIYSVLV